MVLYIITLSLSNSNTVRYIYDATGRKIAQVATYNSTTKRTDYIGEYQYENSALQFIGHEEGRIVLSGVTSLYKNNGDNNTGITASNASLATTTLNGAQTYLVTTSTGTVARAGLTQVTAISVVAGERYKVRAKGYRDKGTSASSNPVYLSIKANGTDVGFPGATLASSAATEAWTEQIVTIPAGATILQAGITWNTTVTAGELFYVNDFEVIKLTSSTPEYQYHLKDHLGNVRLTFTTKVDVQQDLATYETANQPTETSKFLRYDNARRIQSTLFDHTNGAATGYSQRLTGAGNEIYGLAKSLSVMPGDVINAEVFAKYVDTNSGNWTTALATFLSQVASGTAPAGTVVDGAAYTTSTSSFMYAGLSGSSGSSGTGPKAYLNWLVFDKNYALLTGGYQRISSTPREYGQDVAHELMSSPSITITQPGYVYIYLSNEEATPVEVYFDDFKVTQTKSPVIQTDDYYPFGLAFNSYQRENSLTNDFKFQGQERQDELGLNWDSFKWRNHQPEIGRFFKVDPLAEKYVYNSPYAFSENKVTVHLELEGLEAIEIHGTRQTSSGPTFSKEVSSELQRIGGNSQTDNTFRWNAPLLNNESDRGEAATKLVNHVVNVRTEMLESGKITPDEPVTLIGYSHGGNVATQAVSDLSKKLGMNVNLITVSTPAYNAIGDKENPAEKSGINQHIQIIHEKDGVADLANGQTTYSNGKTTNYVIKQNEVEAKNSGAAGTGITSHTQLPYNGQFDDYLKKIPTMTKPPRQ